MSLLSRLRTPGDGSRVEVDLEEVHKALGTVVTERT